jgi:hypothetical protein
VLGEMGNAMLAAFLVAGMFAASIWKPAGK